MFQIINWICFISISLLVVEIMIYFCKDAIKLYNSVEERRVGSVANRKIKRVNYNLENKIAK